MAPSQRSVSHTLLNAGFGHVELAGLSFETFVL